MKSISKLLKISYLLPVFLSIIFWVILAVIRDNYSLFGIDSTYFFHAGRSIFTNPSDVYGHGFYYLPIFSLLISPITFLPFEVYEWVLLFILLFFSMYSIVILNRILILKNINNKFTRCLILLVVFNGHAWFQQFDLLNVKIIALFLFMLFLEREIKARKSNLTIDYKFLSLQFCILSIILSILPYLIFIIPIYLIHATVIRDIFKRVQIKKYILFVSIFIGLNFFFIIYPFLFVDFLNGLKFAKSFPIDIYSLTPEFIINNNINTPTNFLIWLISILQLDISVSLSSIVLSSLFTVVMIVRHKDMLIERKLALFLLFSLIFNSYLRTSAHVAILPIVILLFVDHEKITPLKNYNIFLFIKQNIVLVLGIAIISILMFLPDLEFIYRMFRILKDIPVQLMIFTWTFLYCCLWMIIYFFNKKKLDRKEIITKID